MHDELNVNRLLSQVDPFLVSGEKLGRGPAIFTAEA